MHLPTRAFLPRAAVFAAALLVAALAADAPAQQAPPPTPVRTDAVRKETITDRRRVTGNVRATDRARIAAREGGVALDVPLREGDRVTQGAVLARLDTSRLELDLNVVKAERAAADTLVAGHREEVSKAQRDLEALRALAARDATNPRELRDAETAVVVAESRLRNAESQLAVLDARAALLSRRILDATVRAPFAGTLVARIAEPGAWVAEGAPVAEVVSDEAEAWLDVPQRLLSALAPNRDSIRIESDATGAAKTTTIFRVLPDVDPRTRTFPVVVPLGSNIAETPVAPGSSVVAWVPTGEAAEHLTVSTDAILRNETGPYVYVAMPGAAGAPHSAIPVQVEILFLHEGRAAVRSDRLQAGTLAVVEGNERLWPTAPVAPVAAPESGK